MITPIEAAKYEEVVGEQQSDYQIWENVHYKKNWNYFWNGFS